MTLNFPAVPPVPDLNQPDSYNQRVLDMFTWCFQTMPNYLEGLSVEDFFSVQAGWLDAAAGKVLAPGAFGWGHDAGNGSANQLDGTLLSAAEVSGLYRYSSQHTDAPSQAGVMLHFNRIPGSDWGGRIQVAVGHSGEVYTRVQNSADPVTYDEWVSLLPEKGENANGEYLQLPDGTMYCWDYRVGNLSGAASWTFPAPFLAAPNVVGSTVAGNALRSETVANITSTGLEFSVWDASTNSRTSNGATFLAIGRWK